jgi:hypothetical protein
MAIPIRICRCPTAEPQSPLCIDPDMHLLASDPDNGDQDVLMHLLMLSAC